MLPLRRLRLEGAVRTPPAPTQGTAKSWPLESSRLTSHPPHRLPPCCPQMISGVGFRPPGQGRGIFLLPQAHTLFLPCSPHSPRAPDGPRDPQPLPGKPSVSTLGDWVGVPVALTPPSLSLCCIAPGDRLGCCWGARAARALRRHLGPRLRRGRGWGLGRTWPHCFALGPERTGEDVW